MSKGIIKSILAVLAGILVSALLAVGTDFLLVKLGTFPPVETGVYTSGMLLLAFIYRSIYGVLGAFTTASLAPGKPMKHALILGALGMVVSIIGLITMWDKGSHWYPILLVLTALPIAWLGGKLKVRKDLKTVEGTV